MWINSPNGCQWHFVKRCIVYIISKIIPIKINLIGFESAIKIRQYLAYI